MPKKDGTLGVAERKEIRAFTDLEFRNVRQEIRNQANLLITEKEREIRSNTTNDVKLVVSQADKLVGKARQLQIEVEEFLRSTKEQGITLKGDRYGDGRTLITVSVNANAQWQTEATELQIAEMKREIESQVNAAEAEISRRRTSAERTLLMAAIQSESAKELLESVPKAEEIFAPAKALKA